MNPDDDAPELPPEEVAFNNASKGQMVSALALKPFSPVRERAAQSMGMKMPMWAPDDFAAIGAGKLYAGAARDIAIYVWLCSIPTLKEQEADNEAERLLARKECRPAKFTNGWTVQRADRSPEDAYNEAGAFCDEHNILPGTPAFFDAFRAVVSKGMDIINSRFDISGGEPLEADSGNV